MEEEKKANWFPFSDKQEADRTSGDFSPSFSGKGHDSIELVREDIFNDIGRGAHPGFHRLQLRELPQFLLDKFSFAANSGHLPRTYSHFLNGLEKAGALDDKTLSALKKYHPEVGKAGTQKQQIEVLKPLIEYLGQLQMKKI